MKSFNKTTTLLLVSLIATLVSGGIYSFFFILTKNKTQETAEILEKTESLSGKNTQIASIIASLKNERENIDKLSSYFIKENEIALFIKKIENLGPQSGAEVTLESLEPGVTEKSVPFLSFRIKANGKFEDIERLLILLENMPLKLEWKTARLTRGTISPPVAIGVSKKGTTEIVTWNLEVFLSVRNFIRATDDIRPQAK